MEKGEGRMEVGSVWMRGVAFGASAGSLQGFADRAAAPSRRSHRGRQLANFQQNS